jgi:hypothetical protein
VVMASRRVAPRTVAELERKRRRGEFIRRSAFRIDRREISHIRRATLRRSEAKQKASPFSVRNHKS